MNTPQLALIDICPICGDIDQDTGHRACTTALSRWIRDDNLDYLEERSKHAGWREAL
ncbi:hypothetical protein [Mycolicibacterium fortuitum]|uniref:hypothetical protein n=1 Tax=Mycolicibacterium fortuitum TaxID=1766 RepID=UPI0013F64309|nr:hypothetical protein [Mycolicibacterium fortuitum]